MLALSILDWFSGWGIAYMVGFMLIFAIYIITRDK
jgi:hypothetical protein